jgi:hypothetical protein
VSDLAAQVRALASHDNDVHHFAYEALPWLGLMQLEQMSKDDKGETGQDGSVRAIALRAIAKLEPTT